MKNKTILLLIIATFLSYIPHASAIDVGKLYDDAIINEDEKTDPWNPNYDFQKTPQAVTAIEKEVEIDAVADTIAKIQEVENAQKQAKSTKWSKLTGKFATTIPASKIVAKATGNRLASLEGVWTLKKTVIRRIPAATVQLVHDTSNRIHSRCDARFPYEKNSFEKKVVISNENGTYVFRQLNPVSHHTFKNKTSDEDTLNANFGLKGVLDPENLTYAYTLKNQDYMKQQTRERQSWHNGKIFYEEISPIKIAGTGYEIVQNPDCLGFMRDEIVFELVRADIDAHTGGNKGLKQSDTDGLGKDFNPIDGNNLGIPDGAIPKQHSPKDSALAKSPFKMDPNYKPENGYGSPTAGMH